MALESKLDFYSIEELEDIRVQWLEAKKKIDAEMEGSYPRDIDHEYEKKFPNKNLQVLFKHAAYLYRNLFESDDLLLYPNERGVIIQAYKGILKN